MCACTLNAKKFFISHFSNSQGQTNYLLDSKNIKKEGYTFITKTHISQTVPTTTYK